MDAGLGAAGAIAALLAAAPTELVATFDGEALIDQRARRPVARIVNGVTERLTWPTLELRSGHDLDGMDILYLVGPEPDFKWRSFVSSVVELSAELGVRMAVGLGAFPAPAPHTRPIKLAATAPEESSAVSAGIGVVQGAIEVPAGVWGALELAFGAAGIPAVGLWARVPHYVTGHGVRPCERRTGRRARDPGGPEARHLGADHRCRRVAPAGRRADHEELRAPGARPAARAEPRRDRG